MDKELDPRLILRKFLFIPEKYTRETKHEDRLIALVHRNWLSSLLQKGHPDIFKYHEKLSEFEVDLNLKLGEAFEPSWQLVSIKVLRLNAEEKVYPLPRPRLINGSASTFHQLSYSQLLHYISHTNYKNSWKESHKKYSDFDISKELQFVPLLSKDSVLLEVIKRLYCCPVINLDTREVHSVSRDNFQVHPNCLPAVCALFTSQHLFLVQNHVPHSLSDCVTFSPALLTSARSRSLFLAFQLLQLLRDSHDKGVVIGDVNLHDLLISPSLWLSVVPKLECNLFTPDQSDDETSLEIVSDEKVSFILKNNGEAAKRGKAVDELLDLWVRGQVSNYDYLIALNSLAGRKFGHPSHHHVLPWVTDFSSPNGGWRDLTKSKFRLNKGDRQLDLTYEAASNQQICDSTTPLQIPHHVSDFLSEITYFVYLARRTPKSLLCKHVRPNWVPAEYPSSIQRMQEWTPDECIPEFYSNPNTFKSIHEDLPDLELPSWASSPEQFVEKHRQALESIHVSERLHHWIDLTFGYKLAGSAAVKSKNVCLYLVDSHTKISDFGVVQLFTQPHPHKITPNPYMEKAAPKITVPTNSKRLHNTLPCILSPAALTPEATEDQSELQLETPVLEAAKPSDDTVKNITLPKDFNPVSILQDVESLFHFSSEVLHTKPKVREKQQTCSSSFKNAMAQSRVREMQTLGCLIVELYLANKLKASNSNQSSFEERLEMCLKVVEDHWRDVPFAVRKVTSILLEVDDCGKKRCSGALTEWYKSISHNGLPPPSAHQLLQPLLASVVPFPHYFEQLYVLLAEINRLECLDEETSELEVNIFHKEFPALLPEMDSDGLNLLIPHVVRLLKSESATNAAWRLFDPLAKALGPEEAAKDLLEPISELMDSGGANRAKLYHRSFLLKLMVRFGMKAFINNFIKSLVEAVGGYKDQLCKSPTLESERRKSDALTAAENFSMCDGEAGILSPLDEDSSADSDKQQTLQEVEPDTKGDGTDTENEPEVFVFESNENEEDSAANSVLSPAVALDLMAQLEIDMDQEPEGAAPEAELEEAKSESPVNEAEEMMAITPVQTEWKPQRRLANSSEFPVSEESAESLLWLAHRLGPVLTARHLSRNLLRMLSLCYLGESNLMGVVTQDNCCQTIPGMKVIGDENSTRVISCLTEIAAIYGEQLVIVQYFGHMTELIALCKRKLTLNLEAGLIGCLSLLCSIIPYLSDATLMDQISDILKNIIHPSVRLVGTTRAPFPSGSVARLSLAYKLLEALYVMAMRIGMDMTKLHLSNTLQRYFLAFDKAYDRSESEMSSSGYLEVKREGGDLVLRGSPLQISQVIKFESVDSFSPPAPIQEVANEIRSKALHEIKTVFNEKLAHCIYIPFYRLLGESVMENVMKNEALIRELCYQYEKQSPRQSQCQGAGSFVYLSDLLPSDENLAGTSGSFGTNVSVIGNRIELQRPDIPSTLPSPSFKNLDEVSSIINKRMENTGRHLRGNWFAYWDHEIGRSDKDTKFNFKQIKLQQFNGHTHSVRALHVLDNENSFISGSRDKSVKLWSLRSQGDGSTASTCRWSYNQHRKSVLAIAYVEPMGLVASCDSVVHLWDPFMGATVAVLDGANRTNHMPVNVLHALPAPSCSVLAATTDSTLKMIDVRVGEYVIEFKVANSGGGLIRCLCTTASGNQVAIGQASGLLSLLDIRTGMILSSWKGHEGEVLQLATAPGATIISSSLDQSVATWNSDNGALRCLMKGPSEPVHCLSVYNSELISGTTANRIGVHTAVGEHASFSSTRLRSDAFRGVLTAMAVLPLNRLMLLGSDAGHISLLC